MKSIVGQAFKGFLSPIKGTVIILGSGKKFFLAFLPFVVGIFFIVASFLWAFQYLNQWVSQALMSYMDSSILLTFLKPVLAVLAWGGFLGVGLLGAYFVIALVMGPFFSMLAEDIFRTDPRIKVRNGGMGLILRMFINSLVKFFVFSIVGLLCFLVSFFPPLSLGGLVVIFLMIAFDLMDFSFEADQKLFSERIQFFRKNIGVFFGLAGAIACTSLVPGSFFLLIPIFVAGAADLYIDISVQG